MSVPYTGPENEGTIKTRRKMLTSPLGCWDTDPTTTTESPSEGNEKNPTMAEGILTLEYYEDDDIGESLESSSMGESEKEDEYSGTSPESSRQPTGKKQEPPSCKTYDFMHVSSEQDFLLADGELFENNYFERDSDGKRKLRHNVFSDQIRQIMEDYYKVTHNELEKRHKMKRCTFSVCPRGGKVGFFPLSTNGENGDQHQPSHGGSASFWMRKRSKQVGPFATCAMDGTHEMGDEFLQTAAGSIHQMKPVPDWEGWQRPPHFKERKTKFFTECKHCDTIAFMHRRNPRQHYEDYVNHVTYKQHKNETKVWQQHLADLKFSLDQSDPQYEDILEKSRHYRTSAVIVLASRYSRTPPTFKSRKTCTVLTRKKSAVVIRRPATTRKSSAISKTKAAVAAASLTEGEDWAANEFIVDARAAGDSKAVVTKTSTKKLVKSSSSSSTANKKIKSRPASAMQEKMKVSMARIMKPRQRDSAAAVTKPTILRSSSASGTTKNNRRDNIKKNKKPPVSATQLVDKRTGSGMKKATSSKPLTKKKKETRFIQIQNMKPNISAKLLRRRSNKSKTEGGSKPNKNKKSGRSSSKGRKHSSPHNSTNYHNGGSQPKNSAGNDKEVHDQDQGSYAQFRDKNGDFDGEKFRQSILKMLEKDSGGKQVGKRKKKKGRSRRGTAFGFEVNSLPKIRNPYKNVQSKTISNVPGSQGIGRGGKKKKKNIFDKKTEKKSFDIETLFFDNDNKNLQDSQQSCSEDVSLKSKYSNDWFVASSRERMSHKINPDNWKTKK